mmetsp:Transcript_41308/g.87511  ORF Transcript_41308/g.87511 Transcript_41308/m.87511 type:complete len:161 (+) Transcript_41308:259-741(+)
MLPVQLHLPVEPIRPCPWCGAPGVDKYTSPFAPVIRAAPVSYSPAKLSHASASASGAGVVAARCQMRWVLATPVLRRATRIMAQVAVSDSLRSSERIEIVFQYVLHQVEGSGAVRGANCHSGGGVGAFGAGWVDVFYGSSKHRDCIRKLGVSSAGFDRWT